MGHEAERPDYKNLPNQFERNWAYIKWNSQLDDTDITVSFIVRDQTNRDWSTCTYGIITGYEETDTGRWIDVHILAQSAQNTSSEQMKGRVGLLRTLLRNQDELEGLTDQEEDLFEHALTTSHDIRVLTGDIVYLPIVEEFARYKLEDLGVSAVIVALPSNNEG